MSYTKGPDEGQKISLRERTHQRKGSRAQSRDVKRDERRCEKTALCGDGTRDSSLWRLSSHGCWVRQQLNVIIT